MLWRLSIKVREDQVRIGFVTFSTMVRTDISLGQITEMSQLLAAIWDSEYMAGATHTADAIDRMRDMFKG